MIAAVLLIPLSFGFADNEIDKLQGTWQGEKIVGKGKEIPAENAKNLSFVIAGNTVNRFVIGIDGKDPATILAVATKNGPHVFSLMTGKKGDPPMLGIYELEGDTLKWCFSAKKRPDKFESPEGGDATFMVLKRVKK